MNGAMGHVGRDDQEMPTRHFQLADIRPSDFIGGGATQDKKDLAAFMGMPGDALSLPTLDDAQLRHAGHLEIIAGQSVHGRIYANLSTTEEAGATLEFASELFGRHRQ